MLFRKTTKIFEYDIRSLTVLIYETTRAIWDFWNELRNNVGPTTLLRKLTRNPPRHVKTTVCDVTKQRAERGRTIRDAGGAGDRTSAFLPCSFLGAAKPYSTENIPRKLSDETRELVTRLPFPELGPVAALSHHSWGATGARLPVTSAAHATPRCDRSTRTSAGLLRSLQSGKLTTPTVITILYKRWFINSSPATNVSIPAFGKQLCRYSFDCKCMQLCLVSFRYKRLPPIKEFWSSFISVVI